MSEEKHETHVIAKAVDTAFAILVAVWVLNFLFTKRLGNFILLTLLGGFGSSMFLCMVINAFAYPFGCYDVIDETSGWLYGTCFVGSAIFALFYMLTTGLFGSTKN